jgi:type IVB pilus formation R64 PilN family outer membrane protein
MRQIFKPNAIASAISATVLVSSLAGCGTVQTQVNNLEASATRNVATEQERAAQPLPVITTTPASWLKGQSIQVMPTPSPILAQRVTYHPAQRVSLSDVATWITQKTGLVVDTAEVQPAATSGQVGGAVALPGMGVSPFPPGPMPIPITGPTLSSVMGGSAAGMPLSTQLLSFEYEGPLSGLLDVAANKAGLWWKFSDGQIVFYRTETQTFYIPAINRPSAGTLTISTTTGSGGASSAGSSASGETSTSGYAVDVWKELGKTAQAVAGSAVVVANPSLGSVTVNGTPVQIKHVADWVKTLTENLSQQVSITVQVYRVKITREDNYSWSPSVIFHSAAVGLSLAGPQAPALLSGLTPLSFAAKVLDTATGNATKYSGSQLAVQALSTLGSVTETMRQTVVTLNGQPAPMQVANQLTYLASTTPGAATVIGTAPVPPTLTPGTITTGFTAMFLPQIVNGKIFLGMHMTNSTLTKLDSAGSGGASIQTPNVDNSIFPQNVMLTPGDSLLLTTLQIDNGNSNRSGIGSPNNFALGGGVDNNTGKQLIAIVITAKVL